MSYLILHRLNVPNFLCFPLQKGYKLNSLRGFSSKIYFILQLGYFKSKHLFFNFDFEDRVVDTAFIIAKYFPTVDKKELVT